MIFIFLSLLPPLLWSTVNYVDKLMLSGRFNASKDALMIYSAGFSLIAIAVITPFTYSTLSLAPFSIAIQLVGGLMLAASIHAYLYALDRADVSAVIPLALLVPVFGYLFSYIVLHETLSIAQFIACCAIVLGGLGISLEREGGTFVFSFPLFAYMVLATSFQAAQETLFKYTALGDLSFMTSLFWLHVGLLLYGLLLLIVRPASGKEFVHSVRSYGRTVFGFNLLSEALSTGAYAIRNYAILLAPIVIVMTLNSFQPVFVFMLGILLTAAFPKVFHESLHPGILVQRAFAIAIMVIATLTLDWT